MKVVFMGTPHFAVPALKAIASAYKLVGVITAPDKPAGRGKKISVSPIKEEALRLGAHLMQPTNLKSEEFQEELKSLGADVFVVVAFRMLPESVWSMPPKGTINLHASLLPNYRGAAPINWAIINGDSQTGLTSFFIEKEIDTGKIIHQTSMTIGPNETAGSLHDRMMEAGADLLLKTLNAIDNNTISPLAQTADKDSLKPAPKIFKQDCQISWAKPASEIHNFVRGLSPYPTAWTHLDSGSDAKLGVKIFETRIAEKEGSNKLAGEATVSENRLFVSCGSGSLEILELQLAGKKRMHTADFLRGLKDFKDLRFSGEDES